MKKCLKMGIEIERDCLYNLLFADYQAIIVNDDGDITFIMRKLIEEYSKWGLKMKLNTPEYLVVGGNQEVIQL